MGLSNDTALVLFSGGQDSTVCLAWALERFARVGTIGFDYGQRHAVELQMRAPLREKLAALRPEWRGRLGDDHIVKIDALAAISETALTVMPPRGCCTSSTRTLWGLAVCITSPAISAASASANTARSRKPHR